MPESTYPIKPIGIEYICDVCKVGRMVYTNEMDFYGDAGDRQVRFPHKCSNTECGHTQTFEKERYPTVRWTTQGAV